MKLSDLLRLRAQQGNLCANQGCDAWPEVPIAYNRATLLVCKACAKIAPKPNPQPKSGSLF